MKNLVKKCSRLVSNTSAIGILLIASGGMAIVQTLITPIPALAADSDTYSWPSAPCEFGSGGGTSCANPDQTDYPGDQYDWYENGGQSFSGSLCYYDTNTECFSPTWGFQYRNCTDYVAEKIHQEFGVDLSSAWGNANNWLNYNTNNAHYATDSTSSPRVGDIAVWTGGSFGHVAYVAAVNGSTATFDEYNENQDGAFTNNYTTANLGTPNGYIHIGTLSNSGGTSIGVASPDSGQWDWKLRNTNNPGSPDISPFDYGASFGTPVTGDWDHNGTYTIGVVKNDNGSWLWQLRYSNSSGGADLSFDYGNSSTDIPVVGDWDGNGKTTIGIVRNDNGSWLWKLRNYNSAGPANISFDYGNSSTDIPVTGDWNGDGTTTIGVASPDSGNWDWKLRNSNSAGSPDISPFDYGATFATPVTGDWDGDGKTNIGVVKDDDGQWFWELRYTNNAGSPDREFDYGNSSTDIPVTGNWDGA